MARGKIGEDLYVLQVHPSGPFTSTSYCFGKTVIDTQGYDQMLAVLNIGDVIGSSTFAAKIYENDNNDFTTAVPLTGAVFSTSLSSVTDQTIILANVLVKNHKRYMWIGAMSSGTYGSSATQSANFSAIAILGQHADTEPVSNTLTCDVD